MLWIFLVVLAAIAVLLVACRFCYRLAFYNENQNTHDPYEVPPGEQYAVVADRMLKSISSLDSIPYEQVYITANDGTQLAARYLHKHDNAPVQIQFHGYRSCALRDMCGGSYLALEMGYNVLLVDQRAMGRSGGHTIAFGIQERYDCLDWINYAIDRFGKDTKIVLVGLSMGAATVLMASELVLPENVTAIIADCPYSSPGKIIRKVCRNMKIPGWLAYPFLYLGAFIFGGFRLNDSSAERAVVHSKVPILLFHGEDDRYVPCEMSRDIQQANPNKIKLITFPEAGHGLCYMVDPEKYESAIKSFLEDK